MNYAQQRNLELQILNIPIYDSCVALYTKHIVESLPEPKMSDREGYHYLYTFTADPNGNLNIPFRSKDEGWAFELEIQARDYDTQQYFNTFMNMNMRMHADMHLSTGTDKDLEELEEGEFDREGWVAQLEKELVL